MAGLDWTVICMVESYMWGAALCTCIATDVPKWFCKGRDHNYSLLIV